jgi:hypothetical protein
MLYNFLLSFNLRHSQLRYICVRYHVSRLKPNNLYRNHFLFDVKYEIYFKSIKINGTPVMIKSHFLHCF